MNALPDDQRAAPQRPAVEMRTSFKALEALKAMTDTVTRRLARENAWRPQLMPAIADRAPFRRKRRRADLRFASICS